MRPRQAVSGKRTITIWPGTPRHSRATRECCFPESASLGENTIPLRAGGDALFGGRPTISRYRAAIRRTGR